MSRKRPDRPHAPPPKHTRVRRRDAAVELDPPTGISFARRLPACHSGRGAPAMQRQAAPATKRGENVSQYCLQSDLGSSTGVPIKRRHHTAQINLRSCGTTDDRSCLPTNHQTQLVAAHQFAVTCMLTNTCQTATRVGRYQAAGPDRVEIPQPRPLTFLLVTCPLQTKSFEPGLPTAGGITTY